MKTTQFKTDHNKYFDKFLGQFTTVFTADVSQFKLWEDETLLVILKNNKIELDHLTKAKLLCYKNFDAENCSITTPLEFSNIAFILNDEVPTTDLLDTVPPTYVAWAIECLEKHDTNNEIAITDSVAEYMALCFHDAGFYAMPDDLGFLDGYLKDMNKNDKPIDPKAQESLHKEITGYLELMR